MAESSSPTIAGKDLSYWLSTGIGVVVAALAAMWAIEIVDTVVLDDKLQGGGIHPRRVDGIDGILWAPFLHGGFGHLISNTIPFAVLGGLVSLRGIERLLSVSAIVIVLGGALTWLIAGGGNHVGASGLVFGFLGYLVGAAVFDRKLRSIAIAIVALMLYGGMIWGFVPRSGISWEGHLFGAIAGVAAAWGLALAERQGNGDDAETAPGSDAPPGFDLL